MEINRFAPSSGMHSDKTIAPTAHRRRMMQRVHKIRICRDNRAYALVPFTIPGVISVDNFGPQYRADRDYWIARITANIGRHDSGSHPDDGCPTGSSIKIQMHRLTVNLGERRSYSGLRQPAEHPSEPAQRRCERRRRRGIREERLPHPSSERGPAHLPGDHTGRFYVRRQRACGHGGAGADPVDACASE